MWRSGELLAYTEREGPGRPPAASPTWMVGTLVGVVGVTFAGLLSSDTLCPDHRAWVQILATVGFVSIVGALVGLVRGWASAPVLTLFASSLGLAIGLIDAVHSPTRGRFIALGFGVAMALAGLATMRVIQLSRWDRRELADHEAPVVAAGTGVEALASPVANEMAQPVDDPPGVRAER